MDTWLIAAAWVQAGAALATLLAACLAIWITWKAPQRAAELAERLRAQTEALDLRREEKMRVFRTMMNHRGWHISARESANAMNMIDVAFHDDAGVRAAFGRFLEVASGEQNAAVRNRIYIEILVEMVRSIGLSDSLTFEDIDRGYYPSLAN